mgnify:FL=1|tara:strand:+ start:192 stop:644 length:453 start_codon:yes stop_codon:yes gene_type:complete
MRLLVTALACLISVSVFISCNNQDLTKEPINEIIIDVIPDSIFRSVNKDSIFDKKVIVKNISGLFEEDNISGLFEEDKNYYMVEIVYTGNDSLISFWGGFIEELNFNKASYYWTSDSSINMTLFNTNNKDERLIFLAGSKDGKGGVNGNQ